MQLTTKLLDLFGGIFLCLNNQTILTLGIEKEQYLSLSIDEHRPLSFPYVGTDSLVGSGEVGIPIEIAKRVSIQEGELVQVSAPKRAITSEHVIKKKMRGVSFSKEEIDNVIKDLMNGSLSDLYMAAFVLTQYFKSLSIEEVEYLTRALAESGDTIEFPVPVYDKHSIGGVPGTKISLLIVPIVAAAGLAIPKTSTRAVTSAAGTADVMNIFSPVEFTADELREIVMETKGAIVWAGGKLNLSPAVDKIIAGVAFPLGIDPLPLILSGIMAKKVAVGADFVALDVPVGGGKVQTMESAREYARAFVELAERLNIRLEAALTYGKVPVGHSIGPALEAREALNALMGQGPTSLAEKSINLAGIIFEIAGLTIRGRGSDIAREFLESGKAYKKMKEIIEAQGGNPSIKPDDIPIGNYIFEWEAPTNGWVVEISNEALTQIARVAGAPKDPGAGVYLPKKKESVTKGDVILQIYSNSESKLSEAQALVAKLKPLRVEGILIDHIR